MLEEYPDVMTAKEVMEVLAVSKELLYDLIREKQLPAYKLGKKYWRINKTSLADYLYALEK
jgi:excisionase family DNA binding protein